MSLKLKKLAVATAAAISMGVAGQAQSGDLLFPYVVVGPTVTTILSVINTNNTTADLQYTLMYKEGEAATDNAATCQKFDYRRSTSPFDIQTFDIGGKSDGMLGVMFRDPSVNNDWQGMGQSYATLSGLNEPVRAYLVVDDVSIPGSSNLTNNPAALFGEAFIVEFGSGAVWGYQAGRAPSAAGAPGDFRFRNAGVGVGLFPPAADTHRWVEPVALMPRSHAQTRFFVTPLTANMRSDVGNARSTGAPAAAGEPRRAGDAFVQLRFGPIGPTATTVYDRDEVPASGSVAQRVHCVGAIDAFSMIPSATLNAMEAANSDIGWGWLSVSGQVRSGGAFIPASRGVAASVIKLEFSEGGAQFGGGAISGSFNNAMPLRNGVLTSGNSLFGDRQGFNAAGQPVALGMPGDGVLYDSANPNAAPAANQNQNVSIAITS